MVVYYHKAMCHVEKLVHYLQCQGHSKGLYNQNITIFYYVCALWKKGITVFKVKVKSKVQNVSACLF